MGKNKDRETLQMPAANLPMPDDIKGQGQSDQLTPNHHEELFTPEAYANSVQIKFSLFDFQLVFGMTRSDGTMRPFQTVYVSPQQAKAVLNVLATTINQYESALGPIVLQVKEPSNETPQ